MVAEHLDRHQSSVTTVHKLWPNVEAEWTASLYTASNFCSTPWGINAVIAATSGFSKH